MPRSAPPLAWLLVAGALAACPSGGGSDPRGALAGPAPAVSPTPAKAPDAGAGAATSGSPPAPTPTPGPYAVERVAISQPVLQLYTPRDKQAPSGFQDAGLPSRHQLIATVFYKTGSFSAEVAWHSSNTEIVTVDAAGWVQANEPRGTGTSLVVATALADPRASASTAVTVIDRAKVQVDVR